MLKFTKKIALAAVLSAAFFGFAACSNSSGSSDDDFRYGNDDYETPVQAKDGTGIYTDKEKKDFIKTNFDVSNESYSYNAGSITTYDGENMKYPVLSYSFAYSTSVSDNIRFELGEDTFKVYLLKSTYSSSGEWKTFKYSDILLESELRASFGGKGQIPVFSDGDSKAFYVKEMFTSEYPEYVWDENDGYKTVYREKYKYLCFAVRTSYNGEKYLYTAETDEFDEKTKFAVKTFKVQEGKELGTFGSTYSVICSTPYEYGSYSFQLANFKRWPVTDNSNLITDQTYLDGTYTYDARYYSSGYKTVECTVKLDNGSITMISSDSSNVQDFSGTYEIFGSKITITAGGYTETFEYSIDGNSLKLSYDYSYILKYSFKSSDSYYLEMTKTSSGNSGNSGSGPSIDSSDLIATWDYQPSSGVNYEIEFTSSKMIKTPVYVNGNKGTSQSYDYTLRGNTITFSVTNYNFDASISLNGNTLTLSWTAPEVSSIFITNSTSASMTRK